MKHICTELRKENVILNYKSSAHDVP